MLQFHYIRQVKILGGSMQRNKKKIINSIGIGILCIGTLALLDTANMQKEMTVHGIEDSIQIAQKTNGSGYIYEYIYQQKEWEAEAEQVISILDNVRVVTLSSGNEIAEARVAYNNASEEAKRLIDEQQLIEAENAYEELGIIQSDNLNAATQNGDLAGVLNYGIVAPKTSGNAYLDSLVSDAIENATTEEMDSYSKVQACYTYMCQNYSYAYNGNYQYSDQKSIVWAISFLRDGYGTCNQFSASFKYIMNALGYDARLCYGTTASSRGGAVEHYWTVVSINGVDYIFDPQVERDISRKRGAQTYERFGLTTSQLSSKYFYNTTVQ